MIGKTKEPLACWAAMQPPAGQAWLAWPHRDRYLEQQQTKNFETEVRGVSRSVHMRSRVAFWGGHTVRALQSNINIHYSPQPAAPNLKTEALPGSWPGRYMRMTAPSNTVCTAPQSVRYHKLPPPRVLRVSYQPGQATWRVGSNVFVWNVFAWPLLFTPGGIQPLCVWRGEEAVKVSQRGS